MEMVIMCLVLQAAIILAIILYLILEITRTLKTFDSGSEVSRNWDKTTSVLITSAFLLLIASFFAPRLITGGLFGFAFDQSSGWAGDTIGGLMNPFISMAAVITTGLAFYVQYKANEQGKQQFREQINIQKFESQFYEMLKLQRDNVSEMIINGYDFNDGLDARKNERSIGGRKVFVAMKTEFECILSIFTGRGNLLDQTSFAKCYYLFFFGLEDFEKKHPDESDFIGVVKKARLQHMTHNYGIEGNAVRKRFIVHMKGDENITRTVEMNFNYKPFSGHASRLGHYFRHLFLTVKSTANSSVITRYEDRMTYLKMLRAQLSNHEQMLLFYNWLGGPGGNWENEANRFFTEYRMIHNLWFRSLFDNKFIQQIVEELRVKPVSLRPEDVAMFEVDE